MKRWDIGALRAMQREVRSLKGISERIAQAATPEIDALAAGAVGSRMTSYGEAWAPLKRGGEASAAIVHRMRVVATGTRIRVRLDRIASYHDRGTRFMVARPIIPRDANGIPKPWRAELTAAAQAAFAAAVKDH